MTQSPVRDLLLVEDTLLLAKSYLQFLRNEPYAITHVTNGADALEHLATHTPAVVLLDLELPDMNGLEILKHIGDQGLPCSVIVITAHGSVKIAVEAMRLGAFDFLLKPFNADRLIVTLRNALERQQLSDIVETYREKIDRGAFAGMFGGSLAMQAVYRTIESAAPSKATIFVTGESGTGKELCARAIHDQSPRRDAPFIALNCAAIPRELMESEIFGHVKGSFSGAVSDRDGAATLANGGTLFLDEICEMDIDLQSKLLRFLQTESFQRVGGTRLEQVDIRFVCATNRDPMEEVREGRFREDLYYRLHVIPISLPPLRQRDDDVVTLAEHFLADYAAQEHKRFEGLSGSARAAILSYDWPGNVRELQNVVRQIVVLNPGGPVGVEMLPPQITARIKTASAGPAAKSAGDGQPSAQAAAGDSEDLETLAGLVRPLDEVERETIEHAIRVCGGKVRIAATLLGISHATLYRKINAWKSESADG